MVNLNYEKEEKKKKEKEKFSTTKKPSHPKFDFASHKSKGHSRPLSLPFLLPFLLLLLLLLQKVLLLLFDFQGLGNGASMEEE